MRTLSQALQDTEEQLKRNRVDRCTQLNALRQKEIPLHADAMESRRESIREKWEYGTMPSLGYACDHCGTELVNTAPGIVLTSNPPKHKVGCPGCGWEGTTVL